MAELVRQDITDYKIWPPIEDTNNVVSSISKSHKQIVASAKKEELPMAAIFEDDVMFLKEGAWQYFLSKIPRFFDLYLAGCYSPIKHGWDEATYSYTTEPVGLHAYIIHSQYYDTFLATDENAHIDTAQKSNAIKVCYPMAAIQRPGFSSNNRAWADYNVLLKPEDVYGGLPK
jgi:hypothetical protein